MPRKDVVGKVVSNKMDKTIVVAVEERKPHHKYGKIQIRTAKFKAHDANNECTVGDVVMIEESRPISKDKRWRLVKVLQKSQEVVEEALA